MTLPKATGTPDSIGDPFLALYGSDGVELARDDDGGDGLNAWLEFQAPAAGTYYVEARGFTEDATGRYALNDDPMATEKLAEGIRAFAADAAKLDAMIAAS